MKVTGLLNELETGQILGARKFLSFKNVIKGESVIGILCPMSMAAVIQPALLIT